MPFPLIDLLLGDLALTVGPETVGRRPQIAQIQPAMRPQQARFSDTKSGRRSWASESIYRSSTEAPFNEVVGELRKGLTRDKMRIVIRLP